MATGTPSTHQPTHAFRGFDESVERALGADMRLVYGMAIPILTITGLIVILALSPAVWLVAAIVVLELAAAAVVIYGFMGIIDEPEDTEAGSDLT